MYVNVCTHLFKLTPTVSLFKMSIPECFYRLFFFGWEPGGGGGGVHEGSIMSGLPHQFTDFSADTKQSQINC